MSLEIKNAFITITKEFIWKGYTIFKIVLNQLHSSIQKNGLNLLDIRVRNDAIKII